MDCGRILGLDIGERRTGVAVSDPTRFLASPIKFIDSLEKSRWLGEILGLLSEYEIAKIVVGIPLDKKGEVGDSALNIRKFIALLRERSSVPVLEWDERFTSREAERVLIQADVSRKKRKHVIDKVAASILLQSYLDSLRFRSFPLCDATEI